MAVAVTARRWPNHNTPKRATLLCARKTKPMGDLQSRPFKPDPSKCCEGCVFGGTHAEWCAVTPQKGAYPKREYFRGYLISWPPGDSGPGWPPETLARAFGARAHNALSSMFCRKDVDVDSICQFTRGELMRWPNLGKVSADRIEWVLARNGRRLRSGGDRPSSELRELWGLWGPMDYAYPGGPYWNRRLVIAQGGIQG